MFLDQKFSPKLSLFEVAPPQIVVATKKERVLYLTTFEDVAITKEEVATCALIWNTNSYYIDVENQIFVVNGGKKIRFDEYQVANAILVFVRRHHVTLNGEKKEETSYFLGYEGEGKEKHEMMAMHISPDGSEFRFVQTR